MQVPAVDNQRKAGSRPTMRERQREFTRGLLIAAGRERFESDGYAGTTVEEIAATAGASRATFYLHFKTKLDLLLAIRERLDPDWIERYRELDNYLSSTSRPSRAKLRDWLERALEFWTENASFRRVVDEAHAVEPDLKRRDRLQASNELVSSMRQWLEQRGADREESRQRAIMLELMTAHLFQELSLAEAALDRDIALNLLTDLWWTVFRPSRATEIHEAVT